ncbi:uncharacterized protein LOC141651247 [Silene latifolia]|uniref:uncharacterized protein LOC141651247 n=1 Tax=Silene latifolia TaxID=37657 RepID=UPI003D76BCC5
MAAVQHYFLWIDEVFDIIRIYGNPSFQIYDTKKVSDTFQKAFVDQYNPTRLDKEGSGDNSYDDILQHLTNRVLDDDVDLLCKPFTTKEVRTADFTKAALSILNSGLVLKGINRTFITLILKCDNPEGVKDYRPISLYNVFMRIITKCVTNRLAKVIGYLVGDHQNAIPGRHISDNILLANEAIHGINSHKKGKYGRYAFKADMSKAYDRVKWDFLQAVLCRFGFPERLVNLIMSCVSTVTYEVLFNGSPLQPFQPRSGLRQGDPLLPFLFILCMEVLSCNVQHAQRMGQIQGIRLCRGVTPLTHLFFADDSVFFLQDKGNSVLHLKRLLEKYCNASGQLLNEGKSGVLFSPSTRLGRARKCLRVLKIRQNKGIGKYLGIPTELQGSKKELFKGILENVTKRVSSWNGIFLSPAGRLTLISSVLLNLSNFFLSVFKIPISVANKINSLLSHFLWAGCRSGKTIHWCGKNFLSFPKREGGLGIRNIECLNQALLAKHVWRLVSMQESLFCGVFREKLFGINGFSDDAWIKNSGSMPWELSVWGSKWVNGTILDPKDDFLDPEFSYLKDLKVKDLRVNEEGWKEDIVNFLFKDEYAERILAIPSCRSRRRDEVHWIHTSCGSYTVKSGYEILFSRFMEQKGSSKDRMRISDFGRKFCKSRLWQLPGPQMWKVLVWKILTGSLPVGNEFLKRNLLTDHSCHVCSMNRQEIESLEHLFRDCCVVSRIWAGSQLGLNTNRVSHLSIGEWIINWILYFDKLEESEQRILQFLATLWNIWVLRNNIIFRDTKFYPQLFFENCSHLVSIAIRANQVRGEVKDDGSNLTFGNVEDCHTRIRNCHPFYVIGKSGTCQTIRVKVDASWYRTYEAAIGWVAFDMGGNIFFEGGVKMRAESALQAEAMGTRRILDWARDRGMLHLEVATDCLQLVYQIAGIERKHHLIKGIRDDITCSTSCFHCLCFSFLPRGLNRTSLDPAQCAVYIEVSHFNVLLV